MSEPGDTADQWRRWEAPTVGAHRDARERKGKAYRQRPAGEKGGGKEGPVTASEIESIQEAAHREAWEKGYQEGLAEGRPEAEKRVREITAVLDALSQPLDAVDDVVEQEISDLVCMIARQLIRRELRTSPGEIVAVVREAVEALPSGDRRVRVQLHPEDAALIRELTGHSEDVRWELVEDPSLNRGGCLVSDRNSRVDMRLEQQIGRVLAAMLGEEREAPTETADAGADVEEDEAVKDEPALKPSTASDEAAEDTVEHRVPPASGEDDDV